MRPSLSVRMLTLMARTSVSTWPESLRSARLWPKNPPVNSMTTITEDIASAIQRRRSAFLEGILRSMSNARDTIAGLRLTVLEMVGRAEVSHSYRVNRLFCVVKFHEVECVGTDRLFSNRIESG